MCNEAATIFSKPPFVTHPALRTMVTRRTTSPGQIVELMDSRVMPFDYRVMGEALWYHFTHHRFCSIRCAPTKDTVNSTLSARILNTS
jgi:hypothetical protein